MAEIKRKVCDLCKDEIEGRGFRLTVFMDPEKGAAGGMVAADACEECLRVEFRSSVMTLTSAPIEKISDLFSHIVDYIWGPGDRQRFADRVIGLKEAAPVVVSSASEEEAPARSRSRAKKE